MACQFKIGDNVRKIKGYRYDGVVVSVFQKTSGEWRLVVEITDGGNGNGMLHIFSPEQMEKV